MSLPSSMRAWQFNAIQDGLENSMKLKTVPLPERKPDQHLIKVLYAATNPFDYKPIEAPLLNRLLVPKPASPGSDIAGRIVIPAAGSSLKAGQLVFGASQTTTLFAGGGFREYTCAPSANITLAPEGLSAKNAATIPVAGLSAYQTVVPHVKAGDRVFINGGSGGVGIFAVQIAKICGCHVTTTCSTANVELCQSLGVDEVIDYKKQEVVEALKASGKQYDHAIDNVCADWNLYWRADEYLKPFAKYVLVAGSASPSFMLKSAKAGLPTFFGGGKRELHGFFAQPNSKELRQIADWIVEGKMRTLIDSEFGFEQLPDAVRRQKTGRARGKIVVDVGGEGKV
ncbi:hypothetical protein LTR62_002934 [Meristemomyces frigidus]|uniref:Enoyl reductase (ER) domain-containing protein n=1 Tax=Meristemomyces frigidus TaxID=1508187 RepID=A0AAN7TQ13_9PEZI|nr:hypothetical protein LTR62_002934 [Meristemomyces frigidus]